MERDKRKRDRGVLGSKNILVLLFLRETEGRNSDPGTGESTETGQVTHPSELCPVGFGPFPAMNHHFPLRSDKKGALLHLPKESF